MGLFVSRQFDSSGHVRLDSTRLASTNAGGGTGGVPVLCYHFLRDKSDPLRLLRVFGYVVLSLPLLNDSELWTISVSEFERQMEYLKSREYHTVTLDELHDWQEGRRELPSNPIVITFDDGDESAYDLALPILSRLGFRATLFVVTARVGTRWGDVRCLDWARLRELEESGVFRIESHTDDMHFKVNADGAMRPVFVAASTHSYDIEGAPNWESAVRKDLEQSRAAIERHIGRAPAFLAWPYGAATPELDHLATDVGFLRTCSLRARPNARMSTFAQGAHTPVEISRYTITARTSLRVFRSILEGTYRPSA
jgi:peptidoglycan/xylan/chitin deacetylase (PgdA/CDA1 family)